MRFARQGRFITAPGAAGDIRGAAFADGDHAVAVGATTANGAAPGGSDFAVLCYVATANPLPGTVSERTVTQLYLDLLQRLPEPAGLAFWSAQLDQGASPAGVALAILHGTEYRTNQVQQLYRTVLHRTADPQGLQSALAFLAQNNPVEQLRTALLASDEYFQANGASLAGFIGGVYHDTLGREVDSAGLAAWQTALQSGLSRGQVVQGITSSLETEAYLVKNAYQQFLSRQPDAQGLAAWTAALQAGLTEDLLVASLAGSAESLASV
jgi:hypothetical protein